MIEAVTFDVWETLIHDDPVVSEARSVVRVSAMADVLRGAGFTADERRLREAYDRSWDVLGSSWREGRELDSPEQLAAILDHLGGSFLERLTAGVLSELERAYVEPVFSYPPRLNGEVLGVLETLRARGIKRALICNTGRTPGYAMRRLLDGFGALSYFDALAFSDEERLRKPDTALFQRVLARLAVRPENAAHVGDDLRADIMGAKSAGMGAILFRTDYPADLPAVPDAHVVRMADLPAVIAAAFNR